MFRTLWLRPFARPARRSRSRTAQPGRRPHFRPSIEALEDRELLSTFWVRNTLDCSTFGCGSLREAILESNLTPPGPNFIEFAIPSGPCSTINLSGPLPAITQPVWIDGTTQPGSGGLPAIQLDGSGITGSPNGLTIEASGTVVQGLVIHNWERDGILITNPAGSHPPTIANDVITDNYIGTDCTGTKALANGDGVGIESSGAPIQDNLIGRVVGGRNNVISGNRLSGIYLLGNSSEPVTGNQVEGNYIGTDVTGTTALGNGGDGVDLFVGANNNTIGGTVPPSGVCDGACNLVSGNGGDGIALDGKNGLMRGNVVQENYVGTDVTGTMPLGNGRFGVFLYGLSSNNTIAGNLLSANASDGLIIAGRDPTLIGTNNVVQGNFIGTDRTGTTAYDPSGTLPLGNGRNGVSLHDGANTDTIGGIGFGAGNVISGNFQDGVNFDDEGIAPVTNNLVQGNYIGTDVTGTMTSDPIFSNPLGNGFNGNPGGSGGSGNGVDVQFALVPLGSPVNTIGGVDYGTGNVISGNFNDGVLISGPFTNNRSYNYVRGNYIGTDVTGALAADANSVSFGNGNNGVEIANASGISIGGLSGGYLGGAANVIANNGAFVPGDGIYIHGPNSSEDPISQNSIFHHFPSTLGILVTSPSPSAPTLGPATYTTPAGPLTVPWAVSVGSGTLEFFANNYTTPTDCEGQLYLGSWPVVSGSPATIPGAIPTGYKWISATVTTSDNTSDFSSCTAASGLSPSPGGSPSGGTSPLLAGSLVSVGAALADGDRTVSPPVPQWSMEPGSARAARDRYFANLVIQRDGAAFIFGSLRLVLPGNSEGEALPAGFLSPPAPLVDAGWDLLADGEPSLFGS